MSTGEALGLVFALVLVSGALSTLYMTIAGKGYGGRGDGLCRGCPMAIEQGRDFCDGCIGGRR